MKPRFFLFIGIAMIAVSLIIIFVFIANPSTSLVRMVPEQPHYQNCIDRFTDIYDMDGDNKLNETDKLAVTAICDIMHTDYDRNDTTNIVLFSMTGWLLIIGVPLTIGGIIWLIVSKIKEEEGKCLTVHFKSNHYFWYYIVVKNLHHFVNTKEILLYSFL
jgi:hypothetical protein